MPTRRDPRRQQAARIAAAETPAPHAPLAASPDPGPAPIDDLPAVDSGTVEAGPPSAGAHRNPVYPVGVTIFPLDSESRSGGDWYARDLEPDLSLAEEARFALVRVLVSWKLLEPQVGQYSEAALGRLGELVAAAREHRQQVIVCLFADDRQAELSEVDWGKRRDPHSDGYLIQRELAMAQKVVEELRSEPNVFGWQLADEAFCSGFATTRDLEEWTRQMREAIRELDPLRPITLGADPETLFQATGVDARAAIASCEFGVTHATAAYRAYTAHGPITSGPATYLDSFLLRVAQRGAPVLADCVGVLTLENSAIEEAASLRVALWSGFANGAAGTMLRRLRDFASDHRAPYSVDPFETLVGLADEDGERKPVFSEAASFVRSAARIDLSNYEAPPERTAIVIPAERYKSLPNLAALYDPRACLAAFVGMKEAHVPVTVVDERADFSAFSVLVVPSAFALKKGTWERLRSFLHAGGALALSYGGGDMHPAHGELFGVEFLGDGGPRDSVSCRVAQSGLLGALSSFDAPLAVSNFAQLSCGTATVVATDESGNPLLTVNHVGQGRAVCIAVPLERAIAQGDSWATPAPVRTMLREVYGALARGVGCGSPLECDAPDVELALLQGRADDVVVLINHADSPRVATLVGDRVVASVVDVGGGTSASVDAPSFSVTLGANGVAALRVTYP